MEPLYDVSTGKMGAGESGKGILGTCSGWVIDWQSRQGYNVFVTMVPCGR